MHEPTRQLPTLPRAFDVVRAVSDAGRPLSTSEIAEAIGTGTTIAHRIVRSLEANGYLERDSEKRYRRPSSGGMTRTLHEGLRLLQEVSSAGAAGLGADALAARMGLTDGQLAAAPAQLADAGTVSYTQRTPPTLLPGCVSG